MTLNKVDKTLRKLMHKLEDKKVNLMMNKTVKRYRVQQLDHLANSICKKYMLPMKSKRLNI